MNIKNIRRSYEQLTMLERLSLADNAESRDDENEIRAIIAASPRETYKQTDFFNLMREIKTFRLCNLIVRFSYVMQFDFFWRCGFEESERISNNARLTAFLYVRATDSWQAVCDELGLRPNYSQEICDLLFSVEMLNRKDELLREFAFTEKEAKEFIKARTGNEEIKTIEDEKKAIREALELPTK